MCMAILSEFGVGYPSEEVLRRCWTYNNDGAGYAYLTENDTWKVKKGLQTFNSFWKNFQAENFTEENLVIIHFRAGNAGKINEDKTCFSGCTHPFPITDDNDYLMCEDYEDKNIIMHNGTVGAGDGYLSDSQEAVKYYIAPLLPYLEDRNLQNVVAKCLNAEGLKGSRWFLATGANYDLYGHWIKEGTTNIWYSNDGYLPHKSVWDNWLGSGTTQYPFYYNNKKKKNIIVAPSYLAVEFISEGNWDWDKWDAFDHENNKTLIKDDTEEESIYDTEGKLIGLVGDDGTILWEDEENNNDSVWNDDAIVKCSNCGLVLSGDELISNNCPTCGNTCDICKDIICPFCSQDMNEDELNGDRCPYCYGVVGADDFIHVFNDRSCPYCSETDSLVYVQDRTECLVCGCIFDKSKEGWDAVLDWNPDFLNGDKKDASN